MYKKFFHKSFIRNMLISIKVPYQKGSYALVLKLSNSWEIAIGKHGQLGPYIFPKGTYIYCGSAFGSGGLNTIMMHYLQSLENRYQDPQWHIDALLAVARLDQIIYTLSEQRMECIWSQALAPLPGAFIPAPRFGATGCKNGCPAHLIGFPPRYRSEIWRNVLKSSGVNIVELKIDEMMSDFLNKGLSGKPK